MDGTNKKPIEVEELKKQIEALQNNQQYFLGVINELQALANAQMNVFNNFKAAMAPKD